MEVWLQEFRQKLEKACLEVHLLKKYVDDVIIVCSMAKRGDRVSKEGQIVREMETLGEDIRKGVSKQQNTLRILEEVTNRILPFLKFTGEAAEGDKGIPVLDTTM